MKALRISKEVSLPPDAVTQTFAAIGRKGSGKTYIGTMIAEQMLDMGAQTVALDPIGNWWGLRVGADGKSKGKEIFVIGGDHGDVPLVPEAGKRIAKLIVDKGVSAVLDISQFRLGERKRFCADFGEEILHLKKSNRSPVHIFIEEAQLIIPQRVGPDEARMVGAFEQIVRLGRNYGIGATLVTQRPQSVNKEVLSQVECLFALQMTGPHERKALEDWVHEAGADRKLIGELPGLARGEGYIWSPSWLRRFDRVHFAQKTTFDASATPEVGKAVKRATLSSVDVESLRTDMAEIVAAAEKDDPRALRKKIEELEKAAKNPQSQAVSSEKIAEMAAKEVKRAVIERDREWNKKLEEANQEIARLGKVIYKVAQAVGSPDSITTKVVGSPVELQKLGLRIGLEEIAPPDTQGDRIRADILKNGFSGATYTGDSTLNKGAREILNAIAQHKEEGVTTEEIAVLTGYKLTSRKTYLGDLMRRELIGRLGDIYFPTDAGIAELGDEYRPLPTGLALRAHVMARLPEGEKKILMVVMDEGSTNKEHLMNETNYKLTSVKTYLQKLSARKLVTIDRGIVSLAEKLRI